MSALLLLGCAGAPARHVPKQVTRVPKWAQGPPTPPAPTHGEPRSYFATDDCLNRRPMDDVFDELALEAEAAKHVVKSQLAGVRRAEPCVDANERTC